MTKNKENLKQYNTATHFNNRQFSGRLNTRKPKNNIEKVVCDEITDNRTFQEETQSGYSWNRVAYLH